jgi:hypothetical protein
MGRSCRQGNHGPVDTSSRRRCLAHLVLDQRLQPREPSCASRLHMRGTRLPRSPGWFTGTRPHIHASRDRAATTRRPGALEEMCGSCGSRAVSSSGSWSQYCQAWRSAGCSGAPARRSITVLPAGDTRTELWPLRGTGPCDRRRVLDSPGPSALASSGLPAVSAAVRGGPGRVLRAVGGSHLPAEVPHQTGDETADPGSGLVQQRHLCVSPP